MNKKEQIADEIKATAPGLPFPAGKTPYAIPEGYFNALPEQLLSNAKVGSTPARIIFLKHRFGSGIAAAAALTGILFFSTWYITNRNTTDISKDPQGWVSKEIRKVSDEKLNSFIEMTTTTAAKNMAAEELAWNSKELASLTGDITSEEIKSLLNDVTDEQSSGFNNE